MVTRRNYRDDTVAAARSVMIELVHLLGEYRESLVLNGGWVPELLLPNRDKPHVGNIDVDLALDHRTIQAEGYRTIQESLLSRGYLQGKQPFIFLRKLKTGDLEITVQVDLLAGEYQGTGKSRSHQRIQDIQAQESPRM